MFKVLILLLITITIILFPIPLKLTLKYWNKVLEIFIYNKKIVLKKPSDTDINNNLEATAKSSFIKSLDYDDIKLIIYKVMSLKFKPTLTLITKLEYGLNDAALAAILYGLIHTIHSFMYMLLLNFFKVKKTDLKVTPHFVENDFSMEISSIIYINLGKIIYMAIKLINCLLRINIKHKKLSSKKYKGGNVHG